MIHQGNTQPEENDPLKDAYQRLQEARDNCLKSDLNTCPLDELTALTEELKAAKEGFEEALEHDQKTNTVTAGRHTIWKREFEALDSLAKLNGIDINEVLSGIQATENGRITAANFAHRRLIDISPLAQLTQVKGLGLMFNQIQDISSLAQLTQLTTLTLGSNQIQDISPLAQLTQLTTLGLKKNQIQDISPLAQLTQVKELRLWGNQIQNTRENRETLKKLDLQAPGHEGTFQRDTLDSLAKLNGIDINEVLRGIRATENGWITGADFDNLGLTDISPLAQLTQLTTLDLQLNQIQDISPLAQLTQVKELRLGGNQIQNTRENRETLKKLDQQAPGHRGTFQRDTLDSLAKLNGIDINEVLRGIKATENGWITKAYFDSLKLTDISPLAHLTQLTELYLQNNQIQDISPLAHLTQLTTLDLQLNQIKDISSLAQLTQLTKLGLGGNQIQNTRENRETLKKLEQQAPGHRGTFHQDYFLKRLFRFLFKH